ncbi:MAG: M66 family metalloprotease [Myxococcota bacterium]
MRRSSWRATILGLAILGVTAAAGACADAESAADASSDAGADSDSAAAPDATGPTDTGDDLDLPRDLDAAADGEVLTDATPGPDLHDADASEAEIDASEADLDASDADTSDVETDAPPVPLSACEDALGAPSAWLPADAEVPWPGALQLGQTHVLDVPEARIAPPLVTERAALALFTPEDPVSPDAVVQIGATDATGADLGVLEMSPPELLSPPLEADLSAVPLAPYSDAAWSADLPWSWLRAGVTLRVARVQAGVRQVHEHTLNALGAPHRFTVTRSKILLFGEGEAGGEVDTRTQPAPRIAREFFAALPFAELRWVDTSVWHLDAVVVQTDAGPRLVASEAERLAVVPPETDHWSILKNQFALRMSLANTGRGLTLTKPSDGDSSPYSFGTSVAMGWYLGTDGLTHDIDDAPWAAGWTGWTAMWAEECGNGFIHELGHSLTLQHFTAGTAAGWGIAEQYPLDGTHLATHPWGYDTVRQRLRTWYRVQGAGPVVDEATGALVGKRDPMNGGEAATATACFPPYTAYHASVAQAWAQAAPTLAEVGGVVGVYRWDASTQAYAPAALPPNAQLPTAVDVPVVTVIGVLTADDATSRSYPAVASPSGNLFSLPDPDAALLPAAFQGARWFLEIDYADGSSERALIARGLLLDEEMAHYAVNLDAAREPVSVALYRADAGWPALDPAAATLVHTRAITAPLAQPAPVQRVGRGALAGGALHLSARCEPGLNCAQRWVEATWRSPGAPLTFALGDDAAPTFCAEAGTFSALTLPIVGASGAKTTLTLHGQRVVRAGQLEIAVPLTDATPWLANPDLSESIRLWIPFAENSDLPVDTWRIDGPATLTAFADGAPFASVHVDLQLEILPVTPVNLGSIFAGKAVSTSPEASIYFVLRDAAIGPTAGVWWDDGIPGPTALSVPVYETTTGAAATVVVHAQNDECGTSSYDLNAGRVANSCLHRPLFFLPTGDAVSQPPSGTWRTAPSAPVLLDARRWHAPQSGRVEASYAFEFTYVAP